MKKKLTVENENETDGFLKNSNFRSFFRLKLHETCYKIFSKWILMFLMLTSILPPPNFFLFKLVPGRGPDFVSGPEIKAKIQNNLGFFLIKSILIWFNLANMSCGSFKRFSKRNKHLL